MTRRLGLPHRPPCLPAVAVRLSGRSTCLPPMSVRLSGRSTCCLPPVSVRLSADRRQTLQADIPGDVCLQCLSVCLERLSVCLLHLSVCREYLSICLLSEAPFRVSVVSVSLSRVSACPSAFCLKQLLPCFSAVFSCSGHEFIDYQ